MSLSQFAGWEAWAVSAAAVEFEKLQSFSSLCRI
ncbi:hypothetical protein Pint_35803 [Pistacia integerrima]|uniref:Uncharacterized protein n=1 Tax=Pistacia integerrima TaxID=434235 RepID=A0ACC0Y2W4_9ROSI|nr:hypothetical protein Pint_35803 [Pistacia integerrima]